MPLVFTLKKRTDGNIDLSPLTPDKLAGRNINAIRAVKLNAGGHRIAVRELFDVTGEDSEFIQLRRCSGGLSRIGHDMSRGIIEVRGHAGDYLGEDMSGGRINVQGDAGDWTATGMSGGRIAISGDAGNFTGAALVHKAHGMSGGAVTIEGNAGDRTGDRMRRGMIIVLGQAGSYTGSRMIAGTIVVLGRTDNHAGYGMKRGTIVLGKRPLKLSPAFSSCGKLKMEFLRLFYKQIAGMGRRFRFFREFGPEVQRYAGDISVDGKGEILIMISGV
ncbi:MAG: formylmethanofuran dehydrogenase subunit C [Gammaproteobacteria bacterium]